MKINENDILKFINENKQYTIEEIKKALRKKYPKINFYNDDVEKYIAKSGSKFKNNNFER